MAGIVRGGMEGMGSDLGTGGNVRDADVVLGFETTGAWDEEPAVEAAHLSKYQAAEWDPDCIHSL